MEARAACEQNGSRLGALGSLQSKKKLLAEKRQKSHLFRNDEKEKWIEDYLQSETTVARKRVDVAETAIMSEQNNTTTAENLGATTAKPKTTFEQILNAI
jgi:Uri superfamily endonuclease